MHENGGDMNTALMLDGNAVGGRLNELFGAEMTASTTECATCGKQGMMGQLQAFTQSPGVVLRCSACGNVVMRVVRTDTYLYLDARGAAFLRIAR